MACLAPGDQRALLDVAAAVLGEPLPRSRLLWSATFVTGLAGGGTGLVIVMDHVLADVIGGLAVLARLVGESSALPPSDPQAVPFPAPRVGPWPPTPGRPGCATGRHCGVAGALAFANGNLVKHGPDVVGVHATPFGWAMIGLAGVAILVLIAAAITRFVAWVGAVLHTAELEDQTWFIVLLVTGLLSFGFIAMIVCLMAGPEDLKPVTATPATAKPASRDLESRSP